MALFKFTGDQTTVLSDLKTPTGSTVQAEPGAEVEVGSTTHPFAVLHSALEAVDDEAKKLVAAAKALFEKEAPTVEADAKALSSQAEGDAAALAATAEQQAKGGGGTARADAGQVAQTVEGDVKAAVDGAASKA